MGWKEEVAEGVRRREGDRGRKIIRRMTHR